MTSKARRAVSLVPVAAALALGGCSSGSQGPGGTSDVAKISIVASTDVYGDIAQAVAGDRAEVTSIITSPNQDPHEYETSAQDRLALEKASIVIENGGGYDPFIRAMLDASDAEPVVVSAVAVSGLPDEEGHLHDGDVNEHVWYDFDAVSRLAEELSHELSEIDPGNAAVYAANYAEFDEQIEDLERAAADLKTTADGLGVAVTEPVPLYLLTDIGLVNHTPTGFSEAIEEGADVPVRVLQETLDLFGSDDLALLAYNEQTANRTTEQVRSAADAAGVPVVSFIETLPDGQSYIQWQQHNLDSLAAALR